MKFIRAELFDIAKAVKRYRLYLQCKYVAFLLWSGCLAKAFASGRLNLQQGDGQERKDKWRTFVLEIRLLSKLT